MLKIFFTRYKYHLLGTILFMIPAIWNYFPFVTSDTGAYIQNAYQLNLPNDRPITYSYFILFSSLRISLWITIFIQSLLLSFLVISFLQLPLFESFYKKRYWIAFSFITFFTSCAWYSSQLMPDMFTAIIFLATILFIYESKNYRIIIYAILIFLSILMHNSNLIISILFYLSILCYTFFSSTQKAYRNKAYNLIFISIASWFAICGLNYIDGNGFKPSKSSHIFLIAKLSENGILKKYLYDHCKFENYKLCAFKNELPEHAWDFIWNDKGAFAQTGYWDSSETEYTKIIKGSLTEPKFLILNLKEGLKATAKEFVLTDIGDGLSPELYGSNPYWKIKEHYIDELPDYLKSKQNLNKLNFSLINTINYLVFVISIILCLLLLLMKKLSNHQVFILILCFVFCILNAATTGALANILARLNSRCVWLIPFIIFVISFNIFQKTYRRIKDKS